MKRNKRFELIRQESEFSNEEFYRQYIIPETLDMVRRERSEKEKEEAKYDSYDLNDIYDMNDDLDELDEDLDSLLKKDSILPCLTRASKR